MKKNYILLIFFISIATSYSQNPTRLNENDKVKIKRVSSDLLKNILFIENRLDKNIKYLEEGETERVYKPQFIDLLSIVTTKDLNKVSKYFCYECYQKEWLNQKEEAKKLDIIRQKKYDSTSLAKISNYNVNTDLQENTAPVTNDNLSNKTDPYDKLKNSLRAFNYDNLKFTVFRNIDYSYAGTSLSLYLQTDMELASKNFTITETKITEKFVPKVTRKNEYILLDYEVTQHYDIKGYTDSEPVYIINSLVITGTPEIIAKLFLNYWKGNINIDTNKTGVIAYREILGDYITIENTSKNLFKIKIQKGNTEVDYYKTFGINAPK